jgi:hypothetical protein
VGRRQRHQVPARLSFQKPSRPRSAGYRHTSISSADFGSFVMGFFREKLVVGRRDVIEKLCFIASCGVNERLTIPLTKRQNPAQSFLSRRPSAHAHDVPQLTARQ